MADWFKFFENGLDELRFQYAIGQVSEVTPVWVGILSECCRHKNRSIHWNDDEAYLFGFSKRLNIPPEKVNEAILMLRRIQYIEISSGMLTVLKWDDFQSEYMRKKVKPVSEPKKTPDSVRIVSGQSPDTLLTCPDNVLLDRGEKKEETIKKEEGEEPEAAAQPPTAPDHKFPSLKEVLSAASMRGILPAEAEKFWHHFESSGWIDKNGNPIVKWQSKLATWAIDSRSMSAERAHHSSMPPSNPNQLSGVDKQIKMRELEGVEKKIESIRGTYSGMQTWSDADKAEYQKLKARRTELKKSLGMEV